MESENSKINKAYRIKKYELYSEYLVMIHIMLENIVMFNREDPDASTTCAKHSLILFNKYDKFMPMLGQFKKVDINTAPDIYARELDTLVDMIVRIVCEYYKISEFWGLGDDFKFNIEGTLAEMIKRANHDECLLF